MSTKQLCFSILIVMLILGLGIFVHPVKLFLSCEDIYAARSFLLSD